MPVASTSGLRPDHHEHVCLVVHSEDELVKGVGAFFRRMERGFHGVYVHRYADPGRARRYLEKAGLPVSQYEREGRLAILDRQTAFEGKAPRIDYEHVGRVVEGALAEVARKGAPGLAIFADASKGYFDEGRSEEWFAFETWLGRRLHHRVALLCTYWSEDLGKPGMLDRMTRSHQLRYSPDDL